jgi:hypothetical protein
LSGCRIRLMRGLYVFLPFSDFINSQILRLHLRGRRSYFDLIHARTDYSASVYSYIAGLVRIPMVWDCRGDSFHEIEYSLSKRPRLPALLRRSILKAVVERERRAAHACKAANFVSKLLFERKSRSLHGKRSFVIPCAVSGSYFYFSSELRVEYRKRLNLDVDAVVLVYSGGMSTYQGFAKYIDLFAQMLKTRDPRLHLLIVSPDEAKAREVIADKLPQDVYTVRSARYEEVNGYLNAADYGALLRDNNKINDVSSPTKFGEYCLTGLRVILDGNVQQAFGISQAIENYESYGDVLRGKQLRKVQDHERSAIASRSQHFFSRTYLNRFYDELYRGVITEMEGPPSEMNIDSIGEHVGRTAI